MFSDEYICPTCDAKMPRDIQVIISHTEEDIVQAIKSKHPDWVREGGVCKKCYDYYKQKLHPR